MQPGHELQSFLIVPQRGNAPYDTVKLFQVSSIDCRMTDELGKIRFWSNRGTMWENHVKSSVRQISTVISRIRRLKQRRVRATKMQLGSTSSFHYLIRQKIELLSLSRIETERTQRSCAGSYHQKP